MKIVIYGSQADTDEFNKLLKTQSVIAFRKAELSSVTDYDTFLFMLKSENPDAVFVLADGAGGMEAVIAAKDICRDIAVIWFSNDGGFCAQSYRLGCSFFAEKPINASVIGTSFLHCASPKAVST